MDKDLARGRGKKTFLYKQLAEIIKKEIEDGNYLPGERLPSMDDLSAKYNLNKITVRRSLQELIDTGLIYSIPAQGTFVSERNTEKAYTANPNLLNIGLLSNILSAESNSTGPYHTAVLEGIRSEICSLDANFTFLPAPGSREKSEILKMIANSNLSGVIYIGPMPKAFMDQLLKDGPPAVVVDYHYRGIQADVVQADNREGGYLAMNHLLDNGAKKPLVIAGPKDQSVTHERLEGVLEALKEHQLSLEDIRITYAEFNIDSGYEAMKEFSAELPDAIFCMNDEMALGACRFLNEKIGSQFNKKMSVIGFDDIAWAPLVSPPLSSVAINKQAMGRLIVRKLVERINNQENPSCTTLMPPTLVLRGT